LRRPRARGARQRVAAQGIPGYLGRAGQKRRRRRAARGVLVDNSAMIGELFRRLKSSAPFWSLRFNDERRERLAVRNDIVEQPRRSSDRGAMLSAVVAGGHGYCATADLSVSGL